MNETPDNNKLIKLLEISRRMQAQMEQERIAQEEREDAEKLSEMTNIMQAMWRAVGLAKKSVDEYSRSARELALIMPTITIEYGSERENDNNNVE